MKSVLVLVITSDEVLQDGLVALLTTIPRVSAVLIAENTTSGLRMMEHHSPQVIIIDLALPDNGAAGLLTKIKAGCPGAKTIVLTESREENETAAQFGAETILSKGFSAPTLVKRIEDIFEL